MKKILWVSRHQMTEEQLDDLKRIYGDSNWLSSIKQLAMLKRL